MGSQQEGSTGFPIAKRYGGSKWDRVHLPSVVGLQMSRAASWCASWAVAQGSMLGLMVCSHLEFIMVFE